MLRALGVVMMNATIGCFSGNSAVVPPPMYGAAAGGQTDLTPAEADHADVVYPVDPPPRAATATFVSLPASWQPKAPPRPWKYIVLHHTATEEGDIETIDQEHRQRKDAQGNPWLGIGYHFVVGNGHGMADGLVEPSFRWTDQIHGAHAGNRLYNEQGIGICLVGNFVEGRPTDRQITATRELVRRLSREFAIAPDCILRHQDIGATECPGPNFPLEEIVGRGRAPRAPDRQPPVGALDALRD